ncbi:MAG: amino acid dehydrogenase [Gammaproteobacteria bacterium]|nr:amino acid dehydrogenase [Gammaproteobacteria bacterium]
MDSFFTHPSFDHHEQVIFVSNANSGLRGIIAIHSTALGPAAGGCRMYPYKSVDEALNDVLRLSRGMTMKNAAANLPLGGGKCIIIADPSKPNKEDLLRAMARQVQRLAGNYWTAIDVGVSAEDADIMADECDYIFARASDFSVDYPPSEFTSIGGFYGISAVAEHLRGNSDLNGLRVAIQGVGQTGARLAALLVEQGANVVVADVNEQAVSKVVDEHGVLAVEPSEIHKQAVDIFSPCAMGGILNKKTIAELNCKGIAGLANNQLEMPENGEQLLRRGVAYAPDFIVNAGGMMGASMPIFSSPDKDKSLQNIRGIFDVVQEILMRSEKENLPTEDIAEQMALEKINAVSD